MSKLLPTPNYCNCIVIRGRNLRDKSKNGENINPFCRIKMGKQEFATEVCEKTTSPDWHTQCDMPITDDPIIKLTVYDHTKPKNPLSLSEGEFIGRAYVSLRDLQDYDRIHTKWYKLSNREGKFDKERGEIEVSLQFYAKNDTTGSVLDLTTKKKHLSVKDIKHFGDKVKEAIKHKIPGGDDQVPDPSRRRGGTVGNVHGLSDNSSETTSFTGSHMSLNSMSNNNNPEKQKKKSRASINETPRSSHRSIPSDYETSSILDSASMFGGDETSTQSPNVRSQQHEVNVDENLSSKTTSEKKKTKAPLPKIVTTKPTESPVLTDRSRNFTITDDINKSKEYEITSKSDTNFGLSPIKENLGTDENISSSKHQDGEENDFDNYFKKHDEKKSTKKLAPVISQSKSTPHSKEQKRSTLSQSDDIKTPSTSISVKIEPTSTSTTTKQSDNTHDSTDEDVDELLGKLERMSSMRSSVKRKIQPKDDIMQQSFSEPNNNDNFSFGPKQTTSNGIRTPTLPDIVGQPTNPSSRSKKPAGDYSLSVLGYQNVKSVPIDQKIRQELDYLDRDELLHVISYQLDLIKKRDIRLKDLERYTDGLLCKIVEQCPTILQVGSSSRR